jgi:hypothetical protein
MEMEQGMPSLQSQVNQITGLIAQEAFDTVGATHPLPQRMSLNDPPPVQVPQGQPGTTPVQNAPDGRPDPSKRFAGKYVSVEELEKGHVHAQALITRLQQENAQLRAVPTAASPNPGTPRVNPVERQVQLSDRIKQFGERNQIPAQELAEVVREIAGEVVAETNAPAEAQRQATEYMRQNHPRFFDFQAEVLANVQANPGLQQVVSRELARGNFEGAMETAWSNYALNAGVDVHQRMVANNTVLNQEVEKARVDAGLVPTQAAGVHQAAPDSRYISAERFEELKELARQGYNMPLAREVFGANLPDELFGIS